MELKLEAGDAGTPELEASMTAVGQGPGGGTEPLPGLHHTQFEGICIVDGEKIIDCNHRLAAILGCPREEVIGGAFARFAAPESAETVSNHLRADSGEPFRFVALRKDGTHLPVECRGKTISLRGSRARLMAVVDISALAQAEQDRATLEERLTQSLKVLAVGQLAGGIAHDFNNLLSPIIGYAELILEDLQPDDPMQQSVLAILGAAHRAADMSRQLLAYSRQQVLGMRVIDLNQVLRNFEPRLRAAVPRTIRLSVTTSQAPLLVRGDAAQLEQALLNLVSNCRDAMPQGGDLQIETDRSPFPASTRHATARPREANHALLTVRDTGAGIDPETQRRVFEPFFTTKEGTGAAGLGLSTVYGIVKQHQGQVTLDSEVGQGTVVRMYLPAAADQK
jgi:two-component system, cell cycle sensor histidine kinase and response regulator CckA